MRERENAAPLVRARCKVFLGLGSLTCVRCNWFGDRVDKKTIASRGRVNTLIGSGIDGLRHNYDLRRTTARS